MANYYRSQIAFLREAPGDGHAQVQAWLGPDDKGPSSLSINLPGHLAGILPVE